MTDIVTITPRYCRWPSCAANRNGAIPAGAESNVARVIRRLGGDARAIYPIGGAIGRLLRQLLDGP
jgi:fructose-1-phosphate kinase PfkB-like protein